jgi:hypothetical protein
VVGIKATGPNSSSRSVSTTMPLIASAPSATATARSVNTRPGAVGEVEAHRLHSGRVTAPGRRTRPHPDAVAGELLIVDHV